MTGVSDAQRLQTRESRLFLALSIIVGILAGLAAVLFSLAIERADFVLFGLAPSSARTLLVPAVVSLISGVLLATVFSDVCGSGVPQTKAAFHLHATNTPWVHESTFRPLRITIPPAV